MQSQPQAAVKTLDNQKVIKSFEYKDFADLVTKKVEPFYLDVIKDADALAKAPAQLLERIRLLEEDILEAFNTQPQLLETIHNSPAESLAYFGYFGCKNVIFYLFQKSILLDLTKLSVLIAYATIRHFSAKELKEDEMFSDNQSCHKEHLYSALSRAGIGKLALLKHTLLDLPLLKRRNDFRETLLFFVNKLLTTYVTNSDVLYAIHAISRNIDHIYLQKIIDWIETNKKSTEKNLQNNAERYYTLLTTIFYHSLPVNSTHALTLLVRTFSNTTLPLEGAYPVTAYYQDYLNNVPTKKIVYITPLHVLARTDNIHSLKCLLGKVINLDPILQFDNGQNNLFTAQSAMILDEVDCTPLHVAVKEGQIEIIRQLLLSGCNINAVTNHGNTPLMLATLKNCFSIVKLLCDSGANPYLVNRFNDTPKMWAKKKGYGEIEIILQEAEIKNINFNRTNTESKNTILAYKHIYANPLTVSLETQNFLLFIESLKYQLINFHNTSINKAKTISSETLESTLNLIEDSLLTHLNEVTQEQLIDCNTTLLEKYFPYLGYYAVSIDLIEKLIELSLISYKDLIYITSYAVSKHIDSLSGDPDNNLLIRLYSAIECPTTQNPLKAHKFLDKKLLARRKKLREKLFALVISNLEIGINDEEFNQGLDIIAECQDTELLRCIWDWSQKNSGNDCQNITTVKLCERYLNNIKRALLYSVKLPILAKEKLFLYTFYETQANCDITYNHPQQENATIEISLLHFAIYQEHFQTYYMVANRTTQIDVLCNPKEYNATDAHSEIIDFLVHDFGSTPLHFAAICGKIHIVQDLLSRKANINALTVDGNTPLMLASRYGRLNVVNFLINSKANLFVQNKQQQTARGIATHCRYTAITSALYYAEELARPNQPTIAPVTGKPKNKKHKKKTKLKNTSQEAHLSYDTVPDQKTEISSVEDDYKPNNDTQESSSSITNNTTSASVENINTQLNSNPATEVTQEPANAQVNNNDYYPYLTMLRSNLTPFSLFSGKLTFSDKVDNNNTIAAVYKPFG